MNVYIDISNTILETERLILRPWCQEDLDDFFEYASVDGVGQLAGWNPHKSIEETQTIMNSFIEKKKVFALQLKDNSKVIGSLGIEPYNEEKYPEFLDLSCREIGCVLSKEYWGKGLMPEAVNEAIRYLFEKVGLDIIFYGHFVSNNQSARVSEKCGFKYYASGIYETHFGTIEDTVKNILRKEDYEKNNRRA